MPTNIWRCTFALSALCTMFAAVALCRPLRVPTPPAAKPPSASATTFWVTAGGGVRAENGRAIFYKIQSADATSPQIEIFDRYGAGVETLSPLAAVPDASVCAVWGVSVGQSGVVAVAAVFGKGDALRPVGALLIYNSSGYLETALRMRDNQSVGVEVDDQDHVWSLMDGAGDERNPALAAVLSEYDQHGRLLASFFSFASFPKDASGIVQGPKAGGDLSIGLTDGRVWFWLPQSQSFGAVNTDGTDPKIVITGMPPWPVGLKSSSLLAHVMLHGVAYLASGKLLARAVFSTVQAKRIGLYEYSIQTRTWSLLPPLTSVDVLKSWFVGVDHGESVWMSSVRPTPNYASMQIELQWVTAP